MIPDCQACRNSYDGHDGVLRCRIHSNGLKCSPAAADGCKKFERSTPESDWHFIVKTDAKTY